MSVIYQSDSTELQVVEDGVRLWVLGEDSLRKKSPSEAHFSIYSIHQKCCGYAWRKVWHSMLPSV